MIITKSEIPTIEMDIKVYPNPANGILNVVNVSGTTTIKLYDVNGRLVRQQQAIGKSAQVPVSHLRNGEYLLKMESTTGVLTKKIVIQN